ncbi:DUF948 domain-containing protein [Rhizohabitans arisaemae]|uniref:DUF948 domain-containing protein n=1 Tax=Rhizohabitans arisaemae TaxID=2720610 RepID=UPI0024B09A85|nr:DUF948 domain-containing protein [Rhizohabitans arisaemae]
MLTAGEVAGLIVAVFWAILVSFVVVMLIKLARLLNQTTRMVAELNKRVVPLLDDVSVTVTETNRRLAGAEAISDDAKVVSGNLARLTAVLNLLVTTPVLKLAALAAGVRGAVAARRRPELEKGRGR